MIPKLSLILSISLLFTCQTKQNVQAVSTKKNEGTAIINVNWFDGEKFQSIPLYVVDGLFTFSAPNKIVRQIDAQNGYLIPPFAEGHNHNIFPLGFDETLKNYIEKGVLYAMSQGNICSVRDTLDTLINHDASIDVSFANGGFTSRSGHDVALNHRLFSRRIFKPFGINSLDDLEDNAFYLVEKEEDIGPKLAKFQECQPDFLKIFLSYSEEFNTRKNDPAYFGASGLNPDLTPEIVRQAHEKNLRVSAHVETISDFALAVKAGVDIIAHLPGYEVEDTLHPERYRLTEEMAKAAADKDIAVITTTRLNYSFQRRDSILYQFVAQTNLHNLSVLKKYAVNIGVGSDRYGEVSILEAINLFNTGLYTEKALLKIWTENTPQIIFPDRKIGKIATAFEANFVILRSNPLESFSESVQSCFLVAKKGKVLYRQS